MVHKHKLEGTGTERHEVVQRSCQVRCYPLLGGLRDAGLFRKNASVEYLSILMGLTLHEVSYLLHRTLYTVVARPKGGTRALWIASGVLSHALAYAVIWSSCAFTGGFLSPSFVGFLCTIPSILELRNINMIPLINITLTQTWICRYVMSDFFARKILSAWVGNGFSSKKSSRRGT